jgi:hypothetical protein
VVIKPATGKGDAMAIQEQVEIDPLPASPKSTTKDFA